VRIGAQVFVVGAGEGGMTKLGEIAAADLPARSEPLSPSFSAVLARVLGQHGSGGPTDGAK
jgi:hypothetical protein